jgi:hypothetical protein
MTSSVQKSKCVVLCDGTVGKPDTPVPRDIPRNERQRLAILQKHSPTVTEFIKISVDHTASYSDVAAAYYIASK